MSRRFALTTALLALGALALSPLAAQEDEKKHLLRGPVVSTEGATVSIDVTVAEGVKDVKLIYKPHVLMGGHGSEGGSMPFETVSGNRLRARLEFSEEATNADGRYLQGDYSVVASVGTLCSGRGISPLASRNAKKLSFCALGDTGWGRKVDNEANENQVAIARLLEAEKPELVLHTGDIIYLVGQPQAFDRLFFKPYAATLARVPLYVTLGNHDVKTKNGKPTLDAFPFPANQNGNRYYSFDAANVHFVCLDSNEVLECETTEKFLATAQGKWLQADLAAAKGEWKLVWFHHPMVAVTKGHKDDARTMRHVLEKLLDDAGVDVVLNGHDHFYHRSMRLRDMKPSEQGVVHVIAGGGGAPLYDGEPRKKELTEEFAKRFHLVRFDVDGEKMRIRAIGPDANGKAETFDDATIESRKGR